MNSQKNFLSSKKNISKTLLTFLWLINNHSLQISYLLKSWLLFTGLNYKARKTFYKSLQYYSRKEFLKIEGSLVTLTKKGKLLLSYCFPTLALGESIIVSPCVASRELEVSKSTIRKRKYPLCYLKFDGRLYVIKKEDISRIKEKFPNFPFIEAEKFRKHFEITNKTYFFLRSSEDFFKNGYFLWDNIFLFLILQSKRYFISYQKIQREEDIYAFYEQSSNYLGNYGAVCR